MPQCELCGKKTDELIKTKVSEAELQVCEDCTNLGTKLETNEEEDKDTKYSTSTSSTSTSSRNTKSQSSSSPSQQDTDPFDQVSDLALDYGDRIQSARQRGGMDRQELARELGVKESHLRNIENETTQPSVELQGKIEKQLEIDLGQSDELGK